MRITVPIVACVLLLSACSPTQDTEPVSTDSNATLTFQFEVYPGHPLIVGEYNTETQELTLKTETGRERGTFTLDSDELFLNKERIAGGEVPIDRYITPQDINFDGYTDIKILVVQGARGGTESYSLLLYDPRAAAFYADPELSREYTLKYQQGDAVDTEPIVVTYPKDDEVQELEGQTAFTIRGTASPLVSSIKVHSTCDDDAYTLKSFAEGDTEWQYNVDVQFGNLCSPQNTYRIQAFDSSGYPMQEVVVRLESAVGIRGPEQLELMQFIKDHATGEVGSVKEFIQSRRNLGWQTAQYQEAFCGQNGEPAQTLPYTFAQKQTLPSGLSYMVRTGIDGDERGIFDHWYGNIDDMEYVRTNMKDTPLVVFGEGGPPPIAGWSCPFLGGFTVQEIRPDRIFVRVGGGFEIGPISYMWDGQTWQMNYDFLEKFIDDKDRKYWTPLELTVGERYFSLSEVPYCCDRVDTKYPGKWAEFVFAMDTLQLVDIVLHDEPQH